jgi:hypothetical protein
MDTKSMQKSKSKISVPLVTKYSSRILRISAFALRQICYAVCGSNPYNFKTIITFGRNVVTPNLNAFEPKAGLPDGIFSYQKVQFWYIVEGME